MHLLDTRWASFVALVAMAAAFVACDSAGTSTSTDDPSVEVGFSTAPSSAKADRAGSKALNTSATTDSLVLSGANGTLRIHDIRLILDEVELEGDADSAEFESEKPSFLDLPLDTTEVASVVSDQVPPGLYNEFGFEVEDAELDDSDDDEGLPALQDDIEQAGFPNWPGSASMVAVGTFTPEGDTARSFTTYFEAEIEVEVELEDHPFEIGGNDPSRRLTVNLDPARWFSRPDGTVQNLARDDYSDTGNVVEFEVEYEFEDGVSDIEFDDE